MKKIAFLVLAVLLIYGCQKTQEINEKGDPLISFKANSPRQQLLSLPVEEQIAAFRLMTHEEQANVWIEKIDQIKSIGTWNETQMDLLNSLQEQIKPELYQDSLYKKAMINNFGAQWEFDALNSFGHDNFVLMFMQPHDFGSTIEYLYAPGGGDPAPDCNCAGRLIDACGFPTGSDDTCMKKPCARKDIGCGWLLFQDCKFKCGNPFG